MDLVSHNPATGERIGAVPRTDPGAVQQVVGEVARVQPFWAQLRLEDRGGYLRRAGRFLVDESDDLCRLIAREQGKPVNEAYATEVLPTIDACTWIAEAGAEILAAEDLPTPQLLLKGKRSSVSLEPLGVVGVISPWTYPWSIPFGEVAMALMAGNGVVLKPSPLTPLTGERVRTLFERAGVPAGLVRVVHGDAEVGRALAASSVGTVTFTGSSAQGREVGEATARRLRRPVLTLEGNDPMIVLGDANLDHAIAGALWGAFANAGQTHAGIERAYVVRDVAERFLDGLVAGAKRLRIGDPLEWDTEIGPLTSPGALERVRDLVDEAIADGASLRCGGPVRVEGLRAETFAPAVLTGVTQAMRIVREPVSGPVLPVMVVEDEDAAIALANDSRFGLGASVWTSDRACGERIAGELQTGMVWINDHGYSHAACQTPWGGVKESGVGRTHSRFGFYELVDVKLRVWEPGLAPNLWWHPYDERLGRALRVAGRLLYGRERERLAVVREGAGPLLDVGRRTLARVRRP